MKYIVANFRIDCHADMLQTACDLVAAAAGESGFESFEECEHGLKGYAQCELFSHSTLDSELAGLGLPGVSVTYSIDNVEDRDWNEQWEAAGFDPIDIDGRCVICDARHTAEDFWAAEGAMVIRIEPRQAFGTGTHETTRMVVSELMQMDLSGCRVLDCGCGTGILGIAAKLLGATEVVGYDIDQWSVDNTECNARLNAVEMRVMLGDASVLQHVDGLFRVVVANINRNILLADMPAFAAKMAPRSTLVLSGFYEQDIPLLEQRAAQLGMTKVSQQADNDWACLVLRKE